MVVTRNLGYAKDCIVLNIEVVLVTKSEVLYLNELHEEGVLHPASNHKFLDSLLNKSEYEILVSADCTLDCLRSVSWLNTKSSSELLNNLLISFLSGNFLNFATSSIKKELAEANEIIVFDRRVLSIGMGYC